MLPHRPPLGTGRGGAHSQGLPTPSRDPELPAVPGSPIPPPDCQHPQGPWGGTDPTPCGQAGLVLCAPPALGTLSSRPLVAVTPWVPVMCRAAGSTTCTMAPALSLLSWCSQEHPPASAMACTWRPRQRLIHQARSPGCQSNVQTRVRAPDTVLPQRWRPGLRGRSGSPFRGLGRRGRPWPCPQLLRLLAIFAFRSPQTQRPGVCVLAWDAPCVQMSPVWKDTSHIGSQLQGDRISAA